MHLYLFHICGQIIVVRAPDATSAASIANAEYPGAAHPATAEGAAELDATGEPGIIYEATE